MNQLLQCHRIFNLSRTYSFFQLWTLMSLWSFQYSSETLFLSRSDHINVAFIVYPVFESLKYIHISANDKIRLKTQQKLLWNTTTPASDVLMVSCFGLWDGIIHFLLLSSVHLRSDIQLILWLPLWYFIVPSLGTFSSTKDCNV